MVTTPESSMRSRAVMAACDAGAREAARILAAGVASETSTQTSRRFAHPAKSDGTQVKVHLNQSFGLDDHGRLSGE
jgi:hypothetical protein